MRAHGILEKIGGILCIIGGIVLVFIGIFSNNNKAGYIIGGIGSGLHKCLAITI